MVAFFSGMATGFLKQIFTKSVTGLWENKKSLSLYMKTLFGKYRKKEIRFSISYLFRIKIPGTNSYLLVENRRIKNQFQPVGGAYKRLGDDKLFESWNYKPDKKNNGLGTDEKSENDLRFFVDGKHVIKVIKWFEEGKEREVSGNREFLEEVIETGILSKEAFEKITYRHLKRVSKNLQWSTHHNCYEVLIYDIFELIPSQEQRKELSLLCGLEHDLDRGYVIAECEEIEQLRLLKDSKQIARIGEHTKFTINQNC